METGYTVTQLTEEWAISPGGVRWALRHSGAMAHVIVVGRTWFVSAEGKRLAEEWRRENARK